MADAAAPPDPGRLARAVREARDDAAPFALVAAGILVLLALVSRHAHWELLGRSLWWMWLVAAVPYVLLSVTLLFGLGHLVRHDRRRELVIALLALVWALNVVGVLVLVASLVAHSGTQITGRQLLVSGGVVWDQRHRVRARLLGAGLRRPSGPSALGHTAQARLPVPAG